MILRICLAVALSGLAASAQWLNYPTPGIPRLPNGKVNLNAPLPKATDGKPDLTGLWQRARGANRPVQRTGNINSRGILGGLHHHYVRV